MKIKDKERRKAEPRRLWKRGRCMPEVEKAFARDLDTLLSVIDFRRVPTGHPLRGLWSSPSSEARFELHHLADDLRILRKIDGFAGLLKSLLESADTYDDFRYELRIAGALGRPQGQKLLRLGGTKTGPDIELRSRSGHSCGVACYRANSATPAVAAIPVQTAAIVAGFAEEAAKRPIPGKVFVECIFPAFPLTDVHVQGAQRGLQRLAADLMVPEFDDPSGVRVRRVNHAPALQSAVLVRFLFPIPAREAYRLDRHVQQKFEKENLWASKYGGVAIFAMEQPTLGHDSKDEVFTEALTRPSSGLAMVLTSRSAFPVEEDDVRHRIESIRPVVHPELSAMRFNIGVETFGDNTQGWAGDDGHLEFHPAHAWEEWDLTLELGRFRSDRRLPVSLMRQIARLPVSPGPVPADEAFVKRATEVIAGMKRNLEPLP